MSSILNTDLALNFPDLTVISASAGSGKTHTLALRLLQLLLSDKIPKNTLNNVLAMTFTKNAAAEMRQRVLEYLKRTYHGDKEILPQVSALISKDEEHLRIKCGELIETILQDYSSFQVQTIDSFMARIFRASALEFGFAPALEIKPDSRGLLDTAFEQFARELASDPSRRILLEQLADIFVESRNTSSRYVWNPFQNLSDEVRKLYETISMQSGDILLPSPENRTLKIIRTEILDKFEELCTLIKESGLETTKNFEALIQVANSGDIDDLIGRKSLYNLPVKKSGSAKSKEKAEEWDIRFAPLQESIKELASEYAVEQSRGYYRPFIEAYNMLRDTIEQTMRRNAQVSLSDIYRALLKYISEETVPQVYFYLGDAIFHYLIDEFQDTSPIQWETIKPLLAEALSKQGSLYIVGDMKQSIYAFRHADWKIMKGLMEETIFASAPPNVFELETNYRSHEQILNFSKRVFHDIVPDKMEGDAPQASGLSKFKQEAIEKNRKKGYVEVVSFEQDGELERKKILEIISDCKTRGYNYNEITILTPQNKHVITVSGWLNNAQIRFISHSSLDIRNQSITGEILALLRFLDSPIDDLAFATFILSGILLRALDADNVKTTKEELHTFLVQAKKSNRSAPLYTSFRRQYKDIWNKYFDGLFNVTGYLPTYDLVSEIYKHFRLFELSPNEQASLIKLLEVMKNFEETGQNTLKDFLSFAENEEDESEWNIAVPHGEDAVSIMTIHKAKGLDNRVVIVLLIDSKPITDNLFIEKDESGVRLLRINKKIVEYNKELEKLYKKRRFEHAVDNLNTLYVAFTRAKEEMYIISVKGKTNDEPSKFLPADGYEPAVVKPIVEKKKKPAVLAADMYHSVMRLPVEKKPLERLALYERQRGETIHEILSHIKYIDEKIEGLISKSINEIIEGESHDAVQIKALVLEFLWLPDVQPFYIEKAGRIVLNEQEFVASDGRLLRMDRVVVDTDSVTVLDFKTGDEKEGYDKQVSDYVLVLKDLYPDRTVQGALAFVDRKILRVVA